MEKLSLNEEKVWTILRDFPSGIKAKQLMKLTGLPKTTLYECLDSLVEKSYVENINRKWYPKLAEAKLSTETRFDLFEKSKAVIWIAMFFTISLLIAITFPIAMIKTPILNSTSLPGGTTTILNVLIPFMMLLTFAALYIDGLKTVKELIGKLLRLAYTLGAHTK